MNIVAIIPARMGSSRFPGKPLEPIMGVPMVGHVYLRTVMADKLSDTWVATCDQEIFDYIESIGGKAVMTANTHERCGDRCAEAMLKIEEMTGKKIDVVVLVQGDEPFTTPEMVNAAVEAMETAKAKGIGIACLMGEIKTKEEFEDRNCIKVVVNYQNEAIYMSREPIPTMCKGATEGPWYKQVCLIPYTRDYLIEFNHLEPSQLEIAESIDLNRCIQHGHKVQMAMSPGRAISVDTPADLEHAEKVMSTEDKLVGKYLETAKAAAA